MCVLLAHSSFRTLASTVEKETELETCQYFVEKKTFLRLTYQFYLKLSGIFLSFYLIIREREREKEKSMTFAGDITRRENKPSNLLLMIESDDPFICHVFRAITTSRQVSSFLHRKFVICYLDSFKQICVWRRLPIVVLSYRHLDNDYRRSIKRKNDFTKEGEANINSHRFFLLFVCVCVFSMIIKPHKRKMPEDLLIIMLVSFLFLVRYIFTNRLFSRVMRSLACSIKKEIHLSSSFQCTSLAEWSNLSPWYRCPSNVTQKHFSYLIDLGIIYHLLYLELRWKKIERLSIDHDNGNQIFLLIDANNNNEGKS